ncbi:MAG TPA: hypothetical protein EYQ02_07230 [Microbacterium sp.]|jgi:hypothetical protein|nr:hypothetical protein [Microbacterium sp.]
MTDDERELILADEAPSSTELALLASRERAVNRIFKGVVLTGAGWTAMVALLVADVIGVGELAQQVVQFGAASLIWIGLFVMASATPHLKRFGGKLSAMSLGAFAGMGASGLLAAAEMFETSFLGTGFLTGLDRWGLVGVVFFALLGWIFMEVDRRGRADAEEPAEE